MTPPPFGYRDKFAQARTEALEAAGVETPEDHLEPETPEDDVVPSTPEDGLEPATPEDGLEPHTTDQTSTGGTPNADSSTAAAGEALEGTSPALEDAGHDASSAPTEETSASAAGASDVAAGEDSTGEEGTA